MIIHNMEEKKVFVPYRGFYFLNKNRRYNELCEFVFSSPIGAFIFLITNKQYNTHRLVREFSSPIGAFIFLIVQLYLHHVLAIMFSSPIGAFIFLIDDVQAVNDRVYVKGFRPLSGLLFS